MTSKFRGRLLAAAATVAAAATPAAITTSSAQAELSLGGLLNGVQTVVSSLPVGATGVLCPPTQDTGAGVVTCNLDLLHYRWVTELKRPDGTTLKRQIGATLNLPTLIDVDDDPLPDFNASLSVVSLNPVKVQMRVVRALGEPDVLPIKIEAVAADPTKGSLPRDIVGFGFDTRHSNAPVRYESGITLHNRPDGLGVELRQDVYKANGPIKVVGGVFDGTPSERRDEAGFALGYSNHIPETFGVRGAIGDRMSAELFASTPGSRLQIDGFWHDGADHKVGQATIAQLPTSMRADLVPQGEGRNTVTYTSTARVPSVIGSYHHTKDGVAKPLTAIRAKVLDLPQRLQIEQTAKSAATLTTEGGGIGSLEFGLGSGDEPELLEDEAGHYVNVVQRTGYSSFAGRVDGLSFASFALDRTLAAEAKLARKGVHLRLRQPGRQADVNTTALPGHIGVTLDPAGTLTYDGHGDTIERIWGDVHQDDAIVGRARHANLDVRGLPPVVTLGFKPAERTGGLTATAPIERVEAELYDDPDHRELPAEGEAGIVYRDLPDRYVVAGRILGLREATVQAPVGQPLKATLKTAQVPWRLTYQDATQVVTGRIADVPGEITLTGNLEAGTFEYGASGEIGAIRLEAHRPGKAYFGRATRLYAKVSDLPASMKLALAAEARTVQFQAIPRIGSIEVSATDGDVRLPDGAGNAAVYRDTADEYTVAGRINGLQKVRFAQGDAGFAARVDIDKAPIALEYADAERHVTGEIADVPGWVDVTGDLAAGNLTYTAGDEIGRISVDARKRDGSAWFERAKRLHATLRGLPDNLTVGFKPGGGNGTIVDVRATDTVDALEVSATEDEVVLPEGNGVRFRDKADEWALGARLSHIKGAKLVKLANGYQAITDIEDAPFGFDYADDEQTLKGGIENVPGHIDLTLDLTGGKVIYDASAPIARIHADARRPGKPYYKRAERVYAELNGLPDHLEVGFKPVEGGPDLSVAATTPVTSLEVSASDRLEGDAPLPGEDRNGVLYRDTTGDEGRFIVAARLKGLKEASFKGGDEFIVEARVTPGPVFVDYADDTRALTGHLKDVPGWAKVTITPADGTYRYDADAPISEIRADLVSSVPLKGRIDHARAVLNDVPAGATVTVAPDADGYGVTADKPIGKVFAGVAEGEVHELDAQGAYLRATGEEFKASVRIDGLQKAKLDLDPLTAELQAGAGQPFTIDAKADVAKTQPPPNPCDENPELPECQDPCEDDPRACEPPPCEDVAALAPRPCDEPLAATAAVPTMEASLNGTISALPSSVTLTRAVTDEAQTLTWDADGPIQKIGLEARNLPGDTTFFKPINASVTVETVPSDWTLVLPGKTGQKVAFGTNGQGVGKVEAEMWQQEERWTDLPGGNAVRVEQFNLQRHIFARILGIESFEAETGESKAAAVRFTGQPAPLDIRMAKFRETIHAHIEQPPQQVSVKLPAGTSTKVEYRASAPIPELILNADFPVKPIVSVTINNVPREMDVCLSKGTGTGGGVLECNNEGDWYDNHQELAFRFDTNDDADRIKINGRVCLSVADGHERTVDNCLHRPKVRVTFRDVEFRDLGVELARVEEDNPSIWLDTGDTGLNAGELVYYDPNFFKVLGEPIYRGVVMKKFGEPLYIDAFGLRFDSDLSPPIDRHTGFFRCQTDGNFRAGLVTGFEPDGQASYFDVSGVVRGLFCPSK